MNPPPRDRSDTSSVTGQTKRLVRLLKGSRDTLEELLRPESAYCLKKILTCYLSPDLDGDARMDNRLNGNDAPGNGTADGRRPDGKVLVYRRKETIRS